MIELTLNQLLKEKTAENPKQEFMIYYLKMELI